MDRTIVAIAEASTPLLLDFAVKGAVLLVVAAIVAGILRRDSAATRHLVWMLAIVAILFVPVLSALLPGWRALPHWAGRPTGPAVVEARPPSSAHAATLPRKPEPADVGRPTAAPHEPAAELPALRPAHASTELLPGPAAMSWVDALPIVWAVGFCGLVLRLLAARWMLQCAERHATFVWPPSPPAGAAHDPIVAALDAARLQLGIDRPLTLLLHPDRTIPVVWGVLRPRLMLPASAREWSGEQLRSVLLHELAHIRRRDTSAQLLAQLACALHWFDPMVWLAAWRLGVERERACDDLVLASGVRPSAYAGHLLEVVSTLAPARWTQSCGLAMARASSLEGRLIAVLSANHNRRGVPMALALCGLAMALGITVPVAMLRADDDKPTAPGQPDPTRGARLEPGAEENLRWGKPQNGLRAALAIRPAPAELKAGGTSDLYLVVQNVSDAPIRLNDTNKSPRLRELYIKLDGRTQAAFVFDGPTGVDRTLEPRDVALLLMVPAESKSVTGQRIGAIFAQGAVVDPRETLVGELTIEQAPAGAWTGKLVTGETTGAAASSRPEPKDSEARALFRRWQDHARRNGEIPGGLVGRLGDKVKEFVRINTGDRGDDSFAKKMAPLVPRFDATRDWTPAAVSALLDDIAAITPIPLSTALDDAAARSIQPGFPLPPALANAPWGEPQPNGLRVAWMLEPSAREHRLGTPLKSRILFHNSGSNAVVFRTRTWHQSAKHSARDAKGAPIDVDATDWLTRAPLLPYRLAPGEFVEVSAAGIGVGANRDDEDWQGTRVGAWIDAKAGDEVTFVPDSILVSDWNEPPGLLGEPRWWLDFITDRLNDELPLPAAVDERTRLLERVIRDLFGTAPTAEETAEFIGDTSRKALESLATRLAHRAGLTPFTGSLRSGTTTFRVLPADPDAATKPRAASSPGRYTLGPNARLVVTRRHDGDRVVNDATLQFFSADANKPAPGRPEAVALPDGDGAWAAAWIRGSNVLWVLHRGKVDSYDFTDPALVRKTALELPSKPSMVPTPILDALHSALGGPGAPASASPPAG